MSGIAAEVRDVEVSIQKVRAVLQPGFHGYSFDHGHPLYSLENAGNSVPPIHNLVESAAN
jgi:hypothetical protein